MENVWLYPGTRRCVSPTVYRTVSTTVSPTLSPSVGCYAGVLSATDFPYKGSQVQNAARYCPTGTTLSPRCGHVIVTVLVTLWSRGRAVWAIAYAR
eukprot:3165668-Rhodomonas_salina.1